MTICREDSLSCLMDYPSIEIIGSLQMVQGRVPTGRTWKLVPCTKGDSTVLGMTKLSLLKLHVYFDVLISKKTSKEGSLGTTELIKETIIFSISVKPVPM